MAWRTCNYKDIFGAPKTGAHAMRVGDIAIVDVVATFIVAALIAWLCKCHVIWPFVGLLIISVGVHWLFCVDTTILRLLHLT